MSETHLTRLAMDGLSFGALSGEEAAAAQRHLPSCERCRAELDEIERDRRTFLREVFPQTLPAIEERARPRRWTWLAWLGAPALALAALFVLVPSRPLVSDFAAKGGPVFLVYARRGQSVFQVREAAKLRAGDELRFSVEPGDARFLLIGSVDGAGHASIYYPYEGRESSPVATGRADLPGTIVLDEARGPERLFALFSRDPLEADAVRAALARVGAGGPDVIRETRSLESHATAQVTLSFEKEGP